MPKRPGTSRAERRREPQTARAFSRRRATVVIPIVLLVLVTLFAYRTSFDGVFVFDDTPAIVANPHIRSLWRLSQAMSAPAEVTISGRPIVALSLAVNYALAPPDVRDVMTPPRPSDPPLAREMFLRNLWGYHAMNLLIHLVAGLALFGVVRRTLLSPVLRNRWADASTPVAAAVAALWLVHPLQTESVTYIVQRVESLMGMFYLLTIYCAIRASDSPRPGRWMAGAIACCALGMGSKEVMVSSPIAVVAWDWLLGESPESPESPKSPKSPKSPRSPRRWTLYGGLAATWIILAAILVGESRPHSVGFTIEGWTPWSYLVTQAGVIGHYLRLAFVPSPLVIDYGWRQAESIIVVIVPAAVLVALFAATVVGLVRRWPAAFLGVWFFLILAPSSSILPIATEVAAEHRMYLPLAAVLAAVVFGVAYLGRRFADSPARRARAGLAALVIVGLATVTLGAATASRNRDYWSDEALWRDAVEKRPQNPRARVCYGQDLYATGRVTEAEQQFRVAVKLDDRYALAHLNLGGALCRLGRVDEGIVHLTRASALDPASPEVNRNLGEAYASQGDMAKAVTYFGLAIDRQSTDVFSMNRLGWILATSRSDGLRNGPRAVSLAERAVSLTSRQDIESLDTLAAAYAESRRFNDATTAIREAISLAQRTGRDAMLPELNARLAEYSAGQPHREGK